jgi:hypothetical protein
MKTAYLQWITLPVSISSYCFVCTQANSGSVYWLEVIEYPHTPNFPPTQIRAQNKVPYLILYLTIFGCFFSSQVCRKELGSHRIEA